VRLRERACGCGHLAAFVAGAGHAVLGRRRRTIFVGASQRISVLLYMCSSSKATK
jgi:hypothetical protein